MQRKLRRIRKKENREKTEGQSEEILQWKISRSGKDKNKTPVYKMSKKKERITRIIQKITPHVHIVKIVT